jgi:uncharacterized protein YjdB
LEIMKILKDRKGNFAIWAVVIVMVLLITATAGFEYIQLQIIAQGTRDSVQTAITQICTDNYDRLYNGLREGYSGGYQLSDTNWTENVTAGDLYEKLDKQLGTSDGIKTTGGKTEYRISDLSVHINNAPLAPTDKDGVQQFTGTATYTLTVPLSFGWQSLPPMVIPMTVTAGYSPKGTLTGTGSGTGGSDVPITGVNLSVSELTLDKGTIDTLSASVSPENATSPSLSWTATNPEVCRVDQTGTVTALNAGRSTVIAAAMDGSGIAQCAITVVIPVTGVSLNQSYLTLAKGAAETLAATITPEDATNKSGLWASSDSAVCMVDQTGKVTAINAGTAVISATTQDGSFVAQCTVTVVTLISGITLNKAALPLVPGSSETLTATVWPVDATKQTVLWASSNEDICTVDQAGTVTAISSGIAVVSATTADGQFTAACTVTVSVPVTSVSLNQTGTSIVKGLTETLFATVWPANATNKSVTWSSLNSGIAMVDQSGKVTAVSVGSTTVRVTTDDGGFTADCIVTVLPNTYVVTANAVHGYVIGAGIYNAGSTVTLSAVPELHYHFVNWTNSRGAVISTNSTYVINNLSADTTVTANFAIDMFTVTVIAGTGGNATGGGYYAYGSVITLTAIPNTGYKFVSWSDSNTNATRDITVTDDVSYTATFQLIAVTWTFSSYQDGSALKSGSSVTNTNSAIHSGVLNVHAGSGTSYAHGVYTFNQPLTLKSGSFIYVENVKDTKYYISGETILFINGVSYGDTSTISSGVRRLRFNITSDLIVNTIELRYKATVSNSYTTTLADIVISPTDRNSFELNSTGTSENQNGSRWYYLDGSSMDAGTNSISLDDSSSYDLGAKDRVYINFVKPVAIDHVSYAVTNLGTTTFVDYGFYASDIYGNSLGYSSYGARYTQLKEDCPYVYTRVFVQSGGYPVWNWYWNGAIDSETEGYITSSGSINSDKVTQLSVNWGCLQGPNPMQITIYFKDGTSTIIGTNTAHYSYVYVN